MPAVVTQARLNEVPRNFRLCLDLSESPFTDSTQKVRYLGRTVCDGQAAIIDPGLRALADELIKSSLIIPIWFSSSPVAVANCGLTLVDRADPNATVQRLIAVLNVLRGLANQKSLSATTGNVAALKEPVLTQIAETANTVLATWRSAEGQ